MSEPKVLELENRIKELEKRKTNMTVYTTAEQSYSHTGDNKYLQEPLRFQGSRGNSNDKLTFEKNGIKIGAGINHINVKGIVIFMHSLFVHKKKWNSNFNTNYVHANNSTIFYIYI